MERIGMRGYYEPRRPSSQMDMMRPPPYDAMRPPTEGMRPIDYGRPFYGPNEARGE
jgi:hypothetical protein